MDLLAKCGVAGERVAPLLQVGIMMFFCVTTEMRFALRLQLFAGAFVSVCCHAAQLLQHLLDGVTLYTSIH